MSVVLPISGVDGTFARKDKLLLVRQRAAS
jgi:hypothetical protein